MIFRRLIIMVWFKMVSEEYDTDLVSIIIPAHNNQNSLQKSIESVVNQSYRNIEVLIVENGSTDNTYRIAKKFARRYSRIKVFRTEKRGVSNARNIGLDKAKGDIIGFCDADDFYEPEIVQSVVDTIKREGSQIVVCGIRKVLHGKKSCECILKCSEMWSKEKFIVKVLVDHNVMGSVWNKFFKSELAKRYRFNPSLTLCEDTHYCVSLAGGIKGRISYIKKIGYNYCENNSSATNNIQNHFLDNKSAYILAMEEIEKTCILTKSEYRALAAAKVKLGLDICCLLRSKNGEVSKLDWEKIRSAKNEVTRNIIEYICCKEIPVTYKIKKLIRWIMYN